MDEADLICLRHIRDAAEESLRFAQDKSRPDLDRDPMFVLAVLKYLEIIGEAAGKVSASTRQKHLSVPWDDIIGMRNLFIHGFSSEPQSCLGNDLERPPVASRRTRTHPRQFSPH